MTTASFCPLIKDDCIEHKCKFYIQVFGNHPQTGVPQSVWDCSIAWLPQLLIEGSKETRQAAAAIESFRNRMVEGRDALMFLATDRKKSLDG